MKLNTYLNFNGKCATAFRFYEKVLRGKIAMMMTYGESPMRDQVPSKMHRAILHTTLEVGDTVLMGADAPPDQYKSSQGYSVSINLSDTAEAERVFKALAERGTIQMPLQETFWAARFGMLVDRFGIPWMVNCEKPR
jgi:PhnB protein